MSQEEDNAYTDTESSSKKPNRAERRAIEKEQRKGRKPQRSSRIETTNFEEVDNPDTQYSDPGQPPGRSRFNQVFDSGALDGYIGTNVFRKEISKLQDDQNAFIAWQAKQDEYVIYQNVEFDEELGKDKWEPVSYQYYPLTVGQRLGLQKLEAEVNDLQRAIQNNDRTVDHANERLYEKTVQMLQEQCARYLRMDVDNEFEISNYSDVTLAIASARYAELHIPKLQKMRMPSSVTSREKKSGGIA